MHVKLKSITPNIETTIVEIARVSSSRKDKSEAPEGLINYLIKNKHWSPFEHGMITMEIQTSKAIGIQLLRHRSFTFQEFSQRYAKVTEIEPIEIRKQAIKNRQSSEEIIGHHLYRERGETLTSSIDEVVKHHIESVNRLYNYLLENGVAKECARMILPMATSTTIYMTGTVRSWIHLLDIRDDSHAQKEIQLIAKEMKKIIIEQCPIISKARGWINNDTGFIDTSKIIEDNRPINIQMQDAMKEFIDRVDKGEVVSKYTYEKFKSILKI